MKETLRQLTIAYYCVYAAAIAAALTGFYILRSGLRIDPLSQTGTILNSILIVLIIGCIPVTLAVFNKKTKNWAKLENQDQKLALYKTAGTIRIAIIGIALITGVLFFYIMNSQSMIFCAGIAAIALFFCKPSEAKIETDLELFNSEDQ